MARSTTSYGRQFGLLVSRTVDDMDTLIRRCVDAFKDGRGLVIPLQDTDLHDMLNRRLAGEAEPYGVLLTERLRRIAMA
jgi:hypothetical protein